MSPFARSSLIIGVVTSLIASLLYSLAQSILSDSHKSWIVPGAISVAAITCTVYLHITRPRFLESVEQFTSRNLDQLRRESDRGPTGEVRSTRFTTWGSDWPADERNELRRQFRFHMDKAVNRGVDFRRLHSVQSQSDADALIKEVRHYAGNARTSVAFLSGIDPRLLPELFIAGDRIAAIGLPKNEGGLGAEMGGGIRLSTKHDVHLIRSYYDLAWSAATLILDAGRIVTPAVEQLQQWLEAHGLSLHSDQ